MESAVILYIYKSHFVFQIVYHVGCTNYMSVVRTSLQELIHHKLDKHSTACPTHTFTSNNKDSHMRLPTHESVVTVISSYITDIRNDGSTRHPSHQIYEHLATECHKFYVDAKLPDDISSPLQLLKLMKTVLDEFASVDKTEQCIILTDKTKRARFVWPRFLISPRDAAIIVTRLAAVFSGMDGIRSASYRWKELFTHPSKYIPKRGHPILLMPYSTSTPACTLCNTKNERENCMNCNGSGKVFSPELSWVIRYNVTFDEHEQRPFITDIYDIPGVDLLIASSISSVYYTANETKPSEPDNTQITYPVGTPHCQHVDKKIKANGSLWGAKNKNAAPPEEGFVRYIQRLVRTTFPEFHSEVVVSVECILIDQKRKQIKVAVKGKGCNTCAGKRKDHKDSYIYFLITPQGIKQCCFSKEMVDGMQCKKRMDNKPFKPLPSDEIKRCFPTHIDTRSQQNLSVLNERENEIKILDINIVNLLSKQESNKRKANVLGEIV